MSDVLLERWAKTRQVMEYHGITEELKNVVLQLYLLRSVVHDKAEEHDDEELRGVWAILRGICDGLEDLTAGRLPADTLYLGTDMNPSHGTREKQHKIAANSYRGNCGKKVEQA
ncbi:hypothetical protein [Geotalea toluenoxydans]|uniref:hypothetical protein n=1 Tax=Geotalea toluenoxydans TaxID=421624 RepID=UPI0006CFE9DA|nr:hypothetical protein [Geotalea toluenoxydans]